MPALILWGFPWIGAVGVLIYLAGLQAIGTEVYEAAELDGAGSWQMFKSIELPLITSQVRLTLSCSSSAHCRASACNSCCSDPAAGQANAA